MDKIDNTKLLTIVNSIKRACSVAGCKLIGGETAEMPGVYRYGCLDLAGFSVGTLNSELYPKTERIKPGLKIYGITSNGIHSNGYSLGQVIQPPTGSITIVLICLFGSGRSLLCFSIVLLVIVISKRDFN